MNVTKLINMNISVISTLFQVEMLYQRYFLRMNQTNMTHLLGLLLAVSVGLTIVQIRTLLLAQNFLNGFLSFTKQTLLDSDPFGYVSCLYYVMFPIIFALTVLISSEFMNLVIKTKIVVNAS